MKSYESPLNQHPKLGDFMVISMGFHGESIMDFILVNPGDPVMYPGDSWCFQEVKLDGEIILGKRHDHVGTRKKCPKESHLKYPRIIICHMKLAIG